MTEGTAVGTEEGFTVGHVGLADGTIVGLLEVGFEVGLKDGTAVGDNDTAHGQNRL